jgi:hypothetical protein
MRERQQDAVAARAGPNRRITPLSKMPSHMLRDGATVAMSRPGPGEQQNQRRPSRDQRPLI